MSGTSIFYFNLYQVLRYPYLVFKFPIISKFSVRLFKNINKLFVYFVAHFLKIDKKQLKEVNYSSGTFKLLTESTFFKIGFRWGILKTEINNRVTVHNSFPEVAVYIPSMNFSKQFLFCSIKMKRYKTPSISNELYYAREILKTLSKFATKRLGIMDEFSHIAHGIRLSKILYSSLDIDFKVKKVFSQPWRIGPVHGDFHTGNILVSEDGQPFVIDLDNFSLQGIQALDAFTFWVDYKLKKSKKTWNNVIISAFKGEFDEEDHMMKNEFFDHELSSIAFLYVLNRLGYENRHYGFLSRSVEKEFSLISELL